MSEFTLYTLKEDVGTWTRMAVCRTSSIAEIKRQMQEDDVLEQYCFFDLVEKKPHWTEEEIFLNFDGDPIFVFGKRVEGADASSVMVHYKGARTVLEAQCVHHAWLTWKEASSALNKKSTSADEQRVKDLHAHYETMLKSLLNRTI